MQAHLIVVGEYWSKHIHTVKRVIFRIIVFTGLRNFKIKHVLKQQYSQRLMDEVAPPISEIQSTHETDSRRIPEFNFDRNFGHFSYQIYQRSRERQESERTCHNGGLTFQRNVRHLILINACGSGGTGYLFHLLLFPLSAHWVLQQLWSPPCLFF